ncbi:hypothetical protein CCYN49044_130071 [Capnocytophaga cynodegmi]|uniref:Uncharacterized protein n=1 Tax=Capnocytophaga cynodegmi TaxID=28189 RepID=A0A0B7HVA8_9FLAO|nr:hypothetical protein CCYN49044_130071 [Capnocytophaga cynodegmi]CEN41453.1 hypothetical protein CCYN74_70007 [Capnocytophaga cynodegmi]
MAEASAVEEVQEVLEASAVEWAEAEEPVEAGNTIFALSLFAL